MAKFIDLTGERYGRLVVVCRAGDRFTKLGARITMWACRCDCGKFVDVAAQSLRKGVSRSCGCYSADVKRERLIKRNQENATMNGRSKERLYAIWAAIKRRCYSTTDDFFGNYGGRGIGVCEEWRNNYEIFRKWAYETGYDDTAAYGECTIDRINPDGNYEPSNCRWVRAKEQANNRRSNRVYVGFGKSQNIQQWADEYGIKYRTLHQRLRVNGGDIEKAVVRG